MEKNHLQLKVAAASHKHLKEASLKPCSGDHGHIILDNQIPQPMLRLMQHELDGALSQHTTNKNLPTGVPTRLAGMQAKKLFFRWHTWILHIHT